jgi:5-(carboxyamino)imidazole ribonucleotide synthase
MFAIAARRMGYRVHILSPESDTPAGQIADLQVVAPYDDLDRLGAFARGVDVITFEFENVPAAAAAVAAEHTLVRPSGRALEIAQHRTREKTFLAARGIAVTPFAAVTSERELAGALDQLGYPAVLKTAALGYDGKGQVLVAGPEGAADAWSMLGKRDAVLEAFIELEREVSVIGARGVDGRVAHFEPIENTHRHHILDVSIAPGRLDASLAAEAVSVTDAVMEALEYIGILCIEFFVSRDGRLLVNELAPRPHNSGHLTFDACRTSQFEQQLRAICGLPLGSPELLQPAAMANLLGDLWSEGEPAWERALAYPDVKLHLYAKTAARPGRKMGHLTALARSVDEAESLVLAARSALVSPAPAAR